LGPTLTAEDCESISGLVNLCDSRMYPRSKVTKLRVCELVPGVPFKVVDLNALQERLIGEASYNNELIADDGTAVVVARVGHGG